MNELTKYFIQECKEKQKEKKNNGPIDMTSDQLWKHSNKIEQTTQVGMWISRERKKYGMFLNPSQVARDERADKFDEHIKTLEIDLDNYIIS